MQMDVLDFYTPTFCNKYGLRQNTCAPVYIVHQQWIKPINWSQFPPHHDLAQGIDSSEGGIQLISDVIHKMLHIDVSVLMGANLARDVAKEDFCEATIGMWGWKYRQAFAMYLSAV